MFKRMLVPIDGSQGSSAVVPYAAQLAKNLSCRVDLLLVEPPSGGALPYPERQRAHEKRNGEAGTLVVGSKTPAHVRDANERYVARHVEEFQALGVEAAGQVVCGEIVDEILQAALHHTWPRASLLASGTRRGAAPKRCSGARSCRCSWWRRSSFHPSLAARRRCDGCASGSASVAGR